MFNILVLVRPLNSAYDKGDIISMREDKKFGTKIDDAVKSKRFRILTINGEAADYLIEQLYFEFPDIHTDPYVKNRRYFLRIDEITKDELTLGELETYLEEKPLPDHKQLTDMVI